MSLVRPATLRGFRDILPDEMVVRNRVVERIQRVYETFGFLPLDTPALELLATLIGTGGEETDKLIFTLQDPEKRRIGLRFDLTVPFARIVAQYAPDQIKLPFRRYHIGPVFRADDPQPEQGRFRQFTQFDVDHAGTRSPAADAEIVAVMAAALKAVGLTPGQTAGSFFIRVNDRRVVDAFLAGLGIADPNKAKHVLRVIDKRDKISEEDVAAELGPGRVDRSGDQIAGVGLAAQDIKSIMEFVAIEASSRSAMISTLESTLRPSEARDTALADVELLCDHLEALGVEEDAAILDPSLARGLEYYTGPVFEGTLPEAGVGSVIGGGRYDGLVNRFLEENIPATGASIGLDRLITGLRNLKLDLVSADLPAPVLLVSMSGVPESVLSRVAAELRSAGVGVEFYLGEHVGKMGKQLAYANTREFALALIIGESEFSQGQVAIKDLRAGSAARANASDRSEYLASGTAGQHTVPRSELVATVKSLLSR